MADRPPTPREKETGRYRITILIGRKHPSSDRSDDPSPPGPAPLSSYTIKNGRISQHTLRNFAESAETRNFEANNAPPAGPPDAFERFSGIISTG